LLLVSLWRTPAPAEWRWVGARLAAWFGLRLTAHGWAATAAAVALVMFLANGLFAVQPGEVGLLFRFGAPVATDLAPGIHARLPWPIERQVVIDREHIRRIEFGLRAEPAPDAALHVAPRQSEMFGTAPPLATGGVMFQKDNRIAETFFLTGDGNIIDLRFVVQWRVGDALHFALNVADPEALLRSLALAAMREVAATNSIDAIYTTARTVLEARVAERIQLALDRSGSGMALRSVELLYVHPPDAVHDSFRDVASAQEDKERTINRAQTFSVETINHARGDAAAMLEDAQAFKEERILRAEGDAEAFSRQFGAYREAPDLAQFRLRVEAAEAVLPRTPKLITPSTDNVGGIDLWFGAMKPPSGAR
jgi:membrane protease subunit HflK